MSPRPYTVATVAALIAIGATGCKTTKATKAEEAAAWTAWGEWWSTLSPDREPVTDLEAAHEAQDAATARELLRRHE